MSRTNVVIDKKYLDYVIKKGPICEKCEGSGNEKFNEFHLLFKSRIEDIQPTVDDLKARNSSIVSIKSQICGYCNQACEKRGKPNTHISGCIVYHTDTGRRVCNNCKGEGRVKIKTFNAVIK